MGGEIKEMSAIRETGRIGEGNDAPAMGAPEAVHDGGGILARDQPDPSAAASRRGYRWRIGLARSR